MTPRNISWSALVRFEVKCFADLPSRMTATVEENIYLRKFISLLYIGNSITGTHFTGDGTD